MTRNCFISVSVADIRLQLAAPLARRFQAENRASAFERKGLCDKVVLSAYAADDASVFQSVRNRAAEKCRHHGVVDEPGPHTCRPFRVLAAIERIRERN